MEGQVAYEQSIGLDPGAGVGLGVGGRDSRSDATEAEIRGGAGGGAGGRAGGGVRRDAGGAEEGGEVGDEVGGGASAPRCLFRTVLEMDDEAITVRQQAYTYKYPPLITRLGRLFVFIYAKYVLSK